MTWFMMTCPERIPTPTQVCNHVIQLLLPFWGCFFSLSISCLSACALLVVLVLLVAGINKLSFYVTLSHFYRSRWDDLWWCGGRWGGWLQQLIGQRLELQWVWKLWWEQRWRRLSGKWRSPRFHETKAAPEENPCMSNSRCFVLNMGVEKTHTKEEFPFFIDCESGSFLCRFSLSHIIYIQRYIKRLYSDYNY